MTTIDQFAERLIEAMALRAKNERLSGAEKAAYATCISIIKQEASKAEEVAGDDECIELAQAMEQLRAVKIAEAVAALPIGGAVADMPTPFHAGYQLACEEIVHRLKTEVWEHCLPPVGEPQPTECSGDATRRVEIDYSKSALARDWTEDFAHENGQYQCHCGQCKNIFIGHKRRVVCKTCTSQPAKPIAQPAQDSPAVPGWKLVPIQPTHEMVKAAQFHTERDDDEDEGDPNHYRAKGQAACVWYDMIDAAPAPSHAEQVIDEHAEFAKFADGYYQDDGVHTPLHPARRKDMWKGWLARAALEVK